MAERSFTFNLSDAVLAPGLHHFKAKATTTQTGIEDSSWSYTASYRPIFPYITFKSSNGFSLAVADATKHWDGTLQYSQDTTNWTEWDGTTSLSSGAHSGEQRLYVRGTGNTSITGGTSATASVGAWRISGSNVSIEGDISVLLDYATVKSGGTLSPASYTFQNMFSSPASPAYNDAIVNAQDLVCSIRAIGAYKDMFSECHNLVTPPQLPHTTISSWMCYGMFYNCRSLSYVPLQGDISISDNGCAYMFYGCSLITSPPAACIASSQNACQGMFYGCSSLTTAPRLPSLSFSSTGTYWHMFNGCSSLVEAPELPAETLNNWTYAFMFANCTSLTTPPRLIARTIPASCYTSMFAGCTALESLPELYCTSINSSGCANMFQGCTKIKISTSQTGEYQNVYRIPSSGTLTTTGSNMLQNMFANTGGTFVGTPTHSTNYYTSNSVRYNIASELKNGIVTGANYIASNSSTVLSLSAERDFELPDKISVLGASYVYNKAAGTLTISNPTEHVDVYGICDQNLGCLRIDSPNSFTLATYSSTATWDGTLEYSTDKNTWSTWDGTLISSSSQDGVYYLYLRGQNNTYLTYNSVADETQRWVLTGEDIHLAGDTNDLLNYNGTVTLASKCFASLFASNSQLTKASNLIISQVNASESCHRMFSGCNGLEEAPMLPSTELAAGCYYYMFYRCLCTPALPATILYANCYESMCRGYNTGTSVLCALPALTLADSCYTNMFYSSRVALSSTQRSGYIYSYRVPMSGTGVTAIGALADMFAQTNGYYKGTPAINTTYYASSLIVCAITVDVTNGAKKGDYSITTNGRAMVYITPADGYALPSTVTVSGASYSYDNTTGVIYLHDPTDSVVINAICS